MNHNLIWTVITITALATAASPATSAANRTSPGPPGATACPCITHANATDRWQGQIPLRLEGQDMQGMGYRAASHTMLPVPGAPLPMPNLLSAICHGTFFFDVGDCRRP